MKILIIEYEHIDRPLPSVVDAQTGELIEGVVDCQVVINKATNYVPVVHLTLKDPDIVFLQDKKAVSEEDDYPYMGGRD